MHTLDVHFDLTNRCALCIPSGMTENISIRELRESRGWTQGDMASYFGVDKATIWRWENKGVPTRGPSRKAIERAITALISEQPANGPFAEAAPPSDAAA